MSPEEQRLNELKAQVKQMEQQVERQHKARQKLDRISREIGHKTEEYEAAYQTVLDEFEWSPATARKRNVDATEVMLRKLTVSLKHPKKDTTGNAAETNNIPQ